MKVGDIVRLNNRELKIVSSAYDETGVEIFNVEGDMRDYYEKELELLTDRSE